MKQANQTHFPNSVLVKKLWRTNDHRVRTTNRTGRHRVQTQGGTGIIKLALVVIAWDVRYAVLDFVRRHCMRMATANGAESDLDGVPLRWIEKHTILSKLALNTAPRGRPLFIPGPQVNNAAGTREGHWDPGHLSRRMVQFIVSPSWSNPSAVSECL